MAELIIIYGFLSVFAIIGILFLLQWWFFRKGFYTKYTLHKKAFVRELTGGRLKTPIVSMPPNTFTRVFVCEKRALSMSKFYLGMGFAFSGMGVLGIIMYTIARLG